MVQFSLVPDSIQTSQQVMDKARSDCSGSPPLAATTPNEETVASSNRKKKLSFSILNILQQAKKNGNNNNEDKTCSQFNQGEIRSAALTVSDEDTKEGALSFGQFVLKISSSLDQKK